MTKVYTKTGDQGSTSLLEGIRVKKNDTRIECYGFLDELNSHLGLLKVQMNLDEKLKNVCPLILSIQNNIFLFGSYLASSDPTKANFLSPLDESWIKQLETSIDKMDDELPILKNFIIPGGSIVSSQANISRCVCRRAERLIVGLNLEIESYKFIAKYLNRLSDHLFVLGRWIDLKTGVEEVKWLS
ncbi:MAG: cob(I)yrinic acid a,c-diamide adenosyltransferase [Bdellovibrionales bacterium]